ncbi:hypothetical protein AKJ64_03950 [candidate division MSBL1 archaeon SCGC-AAA259E17]|uniref:SAM-dependent methyltransferase n=1 Tax=candidate division MSBL1 archaeon SCGC-AAA259E17 TaxID=1698263 RepID=A0A133UD73_9EURY|nr:hypothetical protein AKJ64_03950 [candidate division MSBL1 archaeon SCGC-AAA259E17]
MTQRDILPISSSVEGIRRRYGRYAKVYMAVEEWFEREARERGLELLNLKEGEQVLEVGYGTGCALVEMASSVRAQ